MRPLPAMPWLRVALASALALATVSAAAVSGEGAVVAPAAAEQQKTFQEATAALRALANKSEKELTFFAVVAAACRLVDPKLDVGKLDKTVQEMADKAKAAASKETAAKSRVAAVNKVLYGEYGLRTDVQAGKDPLSGDGVLDASLLSRVLERKQGICLGLSTVYLVVTERAGLPVGACHAPGHIFCRYDDGQTRLNIECTDRGSNNPDAAIAKRCGATPAALKGDVYFRPITKKEMLSDQLNNLCYFYATRKNGPDPFTYPQLAELLDLAAKLQPRSYDILDSAALAHFKNDNPVRALAYMDQAVMLCREFGGAPEVKAELNKRKSEYEAAVQAKKKQPVAK